MEIEKLRIGNYYSYYDEKHVGHILGMSCSSFSGTSNVAISAEGGGYTKTDHKDLKPIILTEEWLIKFGFVKKQTKVGSGDIVTTMTHYENEFCFVYLLKDSFEFELITGSERFNLFRQYKYVHELQDLCFAIEGKQL